MSENKKISKWKLKRKLKPAAYVPPDSTADDSFFQLSQKGRDAIETDSPSIVPVKPEVEAQTAETIDILDPDYDEKVAAENEKYENNIEETTEPEQPDRKRLKSVGSNAENAIDLEDDIVVETANSTTTVSEKIEVVEEAGSVEEVKRAKDDLFPEDMDPEMIERIRRRRQALKEAQRHGFDVEVELTVEIENLGKFNGKYQIKSYDRFKDLRSQVLSTLQKAGFGPRTKNAKNIQNGLFIHNNVKVFDTSSPLSLGVSEYEPNMKLVLMTKEGYEKREMRREAEERAKEQERRERELKLQLEEEKRQQEEDEEGIEYGDDNDNEANDNEQDDGFFTIYMKGKDNDPVGVQVNAETQISKLAEYYKSKKGIDSAAQIRLEFDDEDLNINGVVRDTELEEDFTIDVYV